MFTTLRRILEMIRFSHTLFALPFAVFSATMAWTTPTSAGGRITFHWTHLLGILICMVGARSAAMAFNRLVDRDVDSKNPRTQTRHLPAGTLSIVQVWWFTIGSSALFLAGTLLFLPESILPIVLAIPVLLLLLGYSYAKRFTSLAHYWLGIALGLAPICAWIALRGNEILHHPPDILPAVILGGAIWFWVAGFDIIYACQDAAFDAQAGLHSIPARLGVRGALRLAAASHFITVVLFAALPWLCPQVPLGTIYLVGVTAVGLLLLYEHSLVRPDDLSRVNAAFFNVNTIISLGLSAIGMVDLFV